MIRCVFAIIQQELGEFAASIERLKAKSVLASGGFAPLIPRPGALPLDPAGGSAPDPRYRLPLRALAVSPLPNPKYVTGLRVYFSAQNVWKSKCFSIFLALTANCFNHVDGPAAEKLHRPKPTVLVLAMAKSLWSADRRCRRLRLSVLLVYAQVCLIVYNVHLLQVQILLVSKWNLNLYSA